MKNIKYIVFTLLFIFINVFCVHASCTSEEISTLKEETKNIKITYKHLGKVEIEDTDEVYYNYFKLSAVNLSDDFYVMLSKNTNKFVPIDGKIETTVYSGNWDFHIYSNKCEEKINTIDVFIPTFNVYSLDPLCEGIDGEDFELCGKYYEYNIEYSDFIQRVTRYREIHDVGQKKEKENFGDLLNNFVKSLFAFVNQYKLYFLIGLFVILLILLVIIVVKKKKKRGVLE